MMENKLKEIAQRLKELREILGISAEDMAYKTNTTPEEYKNLEAGEADFSFTLFTNVHLFSALRCPTLSKVKARRCRHLP